MGKYRVAYNHKEIRSIQPAADPNQSGDTVLEENTGDTIYAIIEAKDEAEAREKASRLQVELQTGKTKRELTGDEDGEAER